jgi:hypothetical protein
LRVAPEDAVDFVETGEFGASIGAAGGQRRSVALSGLCGVCVVEACAIIQESTSTGSYSEK